MPKAVEGIRPAFPAERRVVQAFSISQLLRYEGLSLGDVIKSFGRRNPRDAPGGCQAPIDPNLPLRATQNNNGVIGSHTPSGDKAMHRVTITIDDDLDAELERFMSTRGYDNRSEAIRDLARAGLQQAAKEISGPRPCVAALVYVYDHEARELPKRLTRDFHKHHDLAQATLHVHLDEESCMEVTVLKGRGLDVQRFADHIIAERGVRHGHVVYLPSHKTHPHVETAKRVRSSGHRHGA
jgi:CopG family transcriptional regulator, nickel-responsive regulator